MNSEDFVQLYAKQGSDESLTLFTSEIGFSLIRLYPEGTAYNKDGRRMFIKIAVLDHGFYYSVNMTKPEKRGESIDYVILGGGQYQKKVTNFSSDGTEEIIFDERIKKVIYFLDPKRHKDFTLNDFIDILVANHLSDRLFLKRKLDTLANWILKTIFWLSDKQYDRVQTAVDKFHFGKEDSRSREELKNIEPFFKYFLISKNILLSTLVVTFLITFVIRDFCFLGDFTLSNPIVVLLFFLLLFFDEKVSIWLDLKIKDFFAPDTHYNRVTNFVERLHNYQFQNRFKLKLP